MGWTGNKFQQSIGCQVLHGLRWWTSGPFALLGVGLPVGIWALVHVMPRGMFRFLQGPPSAIWTRFFLGASFFGTEAFLPLGLTELRGMSLGHAGLSLSAGAIFWVVGSNWQARPGKSESVRQRNASK